MAVDARRQQRVGREVQHAIASYLIHRFGNTLPGLTKSSLYPKALKAVGIAFEDFLQLQIDLAKRRLQR